MIKRFCDCCGDEIVDRNAIPGNARGRIFATVKSADRKHSLSVEVLTAMDGTANAGDFCLYCVLDALTNLDDRPRQVKP